MQEVQEVQEVRNERPAAPQSTRPWKSSLAMTLVGGAGVFLLMANQDQITHGALYGLFFLLFCVAGLLRWLGLLRPGEATSLSIGDTAYSSLPGEPRWMAPRVAVPVAIALLACLGFLLGPARVAWAILAALLALLPAAIRRPGLLVFVLASALYLPWLGSFGLWDPWETHYGEVSREILSRDDWISLWWAQDQWFWSKPIGIFWSEALVWNALGLPFKPDSHFDHVEWALRIPVYVYSMVGLMTAYAAMARAFGRRAGLLGAVILATTPYYAMLTHQAITDMPCVGTMITAVMLLLLAVHEDPERRVKSYRLGPVVVSLHELMLGLFLLICLPQILYLATRNVTLEHHLFAWHKDEFLFGSRYNAGVPGNAGLRDERPYLDGLLAQPLAQALGWAALTAIVVYAYRGERRARPLYLLGFYVFCGLSFMAKGAPGFGLPGLIALLYLLACNRWPLLWNGQLRVALGSFALLTASLPWFIAMYVRHGPAFTDRLVIHDHLNRLASGVHGDTGSIQYFIQQFGYGTFPWIALFPIALGGFLAAPTASEPLADPALANRRRETLIVLGLWFAASFTLYSAMITKFHHYVFPATPPAALLAGVLLDRLLGTYPAAEGGVRARWVALVAALIAPLPLVLGLAGLRGDVRGALPDKLSATEQGVWALQHPWSASLCALLIGCGAGLFAIAWALGRRGHLAAAPPPAAERMLGAGLCCGAVLCAFVGRDLSWTTLQRPAGSERLIQLFIYNYDRPFPADFDYRPIFGGFAIVASLLAAGAAIWWLRREMLLGFLGLSVCFAFFFLDVYMADLTPHWSQEALVRRYYRERKSPKEPLVAWQMNWKGENLYTGNRVAVFVDLNNKEVMDWVEKNKGKTAFFVLEHSRLSRLRSMLSPRQVTTRTTERDNNKFILVRVPL